MPTERRTMLPTKSIFYYIGEFKLIESLFYLPFSQACCIFAPIVGYRLRIGGASHHSGLTPEFGASGLVAMIT